MAYRPRVSVSPLWIFGYGSLVWRPDFSHSQSHPGFIRGWTRRFWQGSLDHRGLPERPGRVVTLLPVSHPMLRREEEPPPSERENERCWGRAYEVSPMAQEEVLAQLDHRERGGYERIDVEMVLFPDPHQPTREQIQEGVLYIATPSNPNFLGPPRSSRSRNKLPRL